jgi:hypothetical protein
VSFPAKFKKRHSKTLSHRTSYTCTNFKSSLGVIRIAGRDSTLFPYLGKWNMTFVWTISILCHHWKITFEPDYQYFNKKNPSCFEKRSSSLHDPCIYTTKCNNILSSRDTFLVDPETIIRILHTLHQYALQPRLLERRPSFQWGVLDAKIEL